MDFFVGQRVRHWKTWRVGTILELPDAASGLEYQTHMLIKFDEPVDWPPAWRRITAFEQAVEQDVARL